MLAHALAKSALFMTAGAVTEATGAKGLSELGGLRPPDAACWPAAAGAAAAATIAALPLTLGFFKDELFFKAALERGTVARRSLAVVGAALTFAYIARFWIGHVPRAAAGRASAASSAGWCGPSPRSARLVVVGRPASSVPSPTSPATPRS